MATIARWSYYKGDYEAPSTVFTCLTCGLCFQNPGTHNMGVASGRQDRDQRTEHWLVTS